MHPFGPCVTCRVFYAVQPQPRVEQIEDVDLCTGQIYSVQRQLGCLLLCGRAAELLDSGGRRSLKYKVKVLLRSQSNFIPGLLVSGSPAYQDPKGRSISIANGVAPGRKPMELALICGINQLMVTGRLPLTSPSVVIETSVCSNNISQTRPHRRTVICSKSRADGKNDHHPGLMSIVFL